MAQSLFQTTTGQQPLTTANSTSSGVSVDIPKYTSAPSDLNSQNMPLMQPSLTQDTTITQPSNNQQVQTQQTPDAMYSPSNGVSTQKVADATYADSMTKATSGATTVPSTAIGSGINLSSAGATRNSYEALLQQYLDQQKQYQDKYLATLAPFAEEQALQQQLAGQKTQAALNQEQALASGETSSFAGGEAQRVARTDAIKQAGIAAQLDVLQNARLGASKQLEALIQSGDTSFKNQLEIQKLQQTVSSIDKQAQDTFFNIAQTEGIDLPYDQTKTATENLSALQKARAAKQSAVAQELSPRQATLLNSLINQANASPLIKAADRAVVLKDSIDNARANPKEGYVQQNLVYSYIQALDTYQSAVREGEMKAVSNLDSLYGRFNNVIQQINNGQYARPEVVKQMADASELLYNSISKAAKSKDQSFKSQAEVLGLGKEWDTYRGGFQRSYEQTPVKDYSAQDKAALDAGYTQAEIDAYKKKRGFSSVGSDTNRATEQNLTADFGNMQGLLSPAKPLEMTSQQFSSMSGLLQSSPNLQQVNIDIPKSSRLSFINNNPGNLKFAGQYGAVKGEGGFAKFSSPQEGLNALVDQIRLDVERGHTLATFIGKYAPPTENNTKLYIQQATKLLGYGPETPLKSIPVDRLAKFVAMKESSTKIY